MSALTIKNIPDPLLSRLRTLADHDGRSLNREVIHLLEAAVVHRTTTGGGGTLAELAAQQAAAWRNLEGRWESELSVREEGRSIMDARTPGRDVPL